MLSLLSLLTLACAPPVHEDFEFDEPAAEGSDWEEGDLLPEPDCTVDEGFFGAREVIWADVETVATVSWTTEVAARSHLVMFSPSRDLKQMDSDLPVGGSHQTLALGLKAQTEYAMVLVAWVEGRDAPVCSEPQIVTTGALPSSLPDFSSELLSGDTAPGYRLMPIISEKGSHVVVFDQDGDAVWAKELIRATSELQPMVFRAEVLPNGHGLMYNIGANGPSEPGEFITVAWTGETGTPALVRGAHTDFALLPDGGIGTLGWDIRSIDGIDFLGDSILERSADGQVREVWNVWDHFAPDPADWEVPTGVGGEPLPVDWTHVNSISYEAGEDAYYVTMTNFAAVIRVDRATGEQTWVLSHQTDDFALSDGALVDFPHSSQRLGDGLLVFNRRNPHAADTCSEATMMTLDEEAGTAVGLWSYQGERCAQVGFLGNAATIGPENILVSWSNLGQVDEVDPAGDLAWRVVLDAGAGFAYATSAERLR